MAYKKATDPYCCRPFARGVEGTAECECQQCFIDCCNPTCPPPCTCETVTIIYQCGESESACNPDGCSNIPIECEAPCQLTALQLQPSVREIQNQYLDGFPEFPEFSKDFMQVEAQSEFVFALDDCCSIPCSQLTVTVSSGEGMCGLELDGCSIFAIGPGTVSASIAGDLPPECGVLQVLVNGNPDFATVADGDSIFVTLDLTEGECTSCGCSAIRYSDPCRPSEASALSSNWIVHNGKIYLNTKSILRKANEIRKYKILKRMQKIAQRKGYVLKRKMKHRSSHNIF